jgi:hypothetical protein
MSLATELIAVMIIALILLSAVLAWAPIAICLIRGRRLSRRVWGGLIAFTLSPLLLLIFALGDFMLSDSHKFALVGVPCCVLAIKLARAGTSASQSVRFGIAVSSLLNIVIWLFYCTLH